MTLLAILFYSFCIVIIIQIFYYTLFLFAFASKTPQVKRFKTVPVSVIICAKNEAENLQENISHYLNQNYPNFEIVLINDNSSDETLEVMEAYGAKHFNIKIVNVKPIEKYWGNKKYALTLGIKAASHDFLLFTDADCKPASSFWIRDMASHFSNEKSLVLGYGKYEKNKSFLNKLIRFETLLCGIQYLGYAKLGIPYMGVGRNLAYRKSLFFNNAGFMNHMHVNSGDDDLFVNAVANASNTTISISPNSFTISEPKKSFKDWEIQKRRHISTAKHYKPKHKILLALFYLSQFLFWILATLLLATGYLWQIVLCMVLIRIILQLLSFYVAAKTLNEKGLLPFILILEPFLILFQLYIFINNLISKPLYWK